MSDIASILNDPDLIHTRDRHLGQLEEIRFSKLHEPIVLNGEYGQGKAHPYEQPRRWVHESLDHLSTVAEKAADEEVFRPLCVEFGPYGVHFIDMIFGAQVFFNNTSGQWYNEHLDTPIGGLDYPDLERNSTWVLAKTVAAAFVEFEVKLPLFGLPTIASALNIAVNLYGQEILIAMHTEPKRARHDLLVINEVLVDLHKWYQEHIPYEQLQPVVAAHRTQPPGCGQICGCTSQLVSADMYNEFIAPLDDALLSVYPNGGMIHLCGSHTQHIPTWRDMRSVRAIQLNDEAAEDLDVYFHGLRDDQVLYVNPCEGMTAEKAMQITGGVCLVLVGEFSKRAYKGVYKL